MVNGTAFAVQTACLSVSHVPLTPQVELVERYECAGAAEAWLRGCVDIMQRTMRHMINEAHASYVEQPRTSWLDGYCAQAWTMQPLLPGPSDSMSKVGKMEALYSVGIKFPTENWESERRLGRVGRGPAESGRGLRESWQRAAEGWKRVGLTLHSLVLCSKFWWVKVRVMGTNVRVFRSMLFTVCREREVGEKWST